ncbi:MAG TPA: hypothetical protein VGE72_01950, partial [Azospirillum sp.]
LTRVDVGDDADVADVGERSLARHEAVPFQIESGTRSVTVGVRSGSVRVAVFYCDLLGGVGTTL